MLIYICDDAPDEQKKIQFMLEKYAQEISIHFEYKLFDSGKDLLLAYNENPEGAALIFLDIYMSGISGVDAAKALRSKNINCGIIFTTSSLEHAMASYEVNALYYLQKPYTYDDFKNAMVRCSDLMARELTSFSIHVRGKELSFPHKDIVYFETGNHSVILHTMNEHHSFISSMGKVFDCFSSNSNFINCGRSYLINTEYVEKYEQGELYLREGSIIPVPVREREKIRLALL